MAHVRVKSIILGLAAMALLGAMALVTSSAQAALPAESTPALFLLLDPGKTFAEEGIAEVSAAGTTGPGRMVVPGRGMAIGCEAAHFTGSVTATEIKGKALLLGCTVWAIQKLAGEHSYQLGSQTACHITNLEITVESSKISVVEHGGQYFALAQGAPFTQFTFLSGTGCPLPLSTTISGSVSAEIKAGQHVFQELKASPQIQLLTGDKLLYGAFESYVEGGALALSSTITGPEGFIGAAWGVH